MDAELAYFEQLGLDELNREISLAVETLHSENSVRIRYHQAKCTAAAVATYREECEALLEEYKQGLVNVMSKYLFLTAEVLNEQPKKFKMLYSQILRKYEQTNKPVPPIEQWEVPMPVSVPGPVLQPDFCDRSASQRSASRFWRRQRRDSLTKVLTARIHYTRRGALTHLKALHIEFGQYRPQHDFQMGLDVTEHANKSNLELISEMFAQDWSLLWQGAYTEYAKAIRQKLAEIHIMMNGPSEMASNIGTSQQAMYENDVYTRSIRSRNCVSNSSLGSTLRALGDVPSTHSVSFAVEDSELLNIEQRMR